MAELTPEAKQKRREYMRKYRESHKERFKEYNRRYWEKKSKQGEEADTVPAN